ncbi:SprT family zinc-dependent metalloprotease [uncultured Oceanicoccus sp.]|uniref:M48 family metallopeptidase n=1 Tax=uncultured Oceanicoccus sp. TaxID=1706381 RepID=UPI0030DBAA9E
MSFLQRSVTQQQLQLSLDNTFDYQVKRQRRKTLALHVLADATVEVRAPKWVPKYEIVDFVEQRADWILEQRREALAKLALAPVFHHGQYHYFLGEQYPLHIIEGAKTQVSFSDSVIVVSVRDKSNSAQIEKAINQWYRQSAIAIYEERLFACFEMFPDWFQDKYTMPQITVRKMRRRWGSCSSKGEVTLNLSLIKMPVECIDYVIAHELSHLEVFHHGKAFYRLLAYVMPDWRERELLIEELS